MDCDQTIRDILARAEAPADGPDPLAVDEQCLMELSALPEECVAAIRRAAEAMLARAGGSDWDEYQFQMLLEALVLRGRAGAFELASKALLGGETLDKETYVDLLDALDDPRVAPLLLRVLAEQRPSDEEGGWFRAKAIDALNVRRSASAKGEVIRFVKDPAEQVRKAAIRFLIDLGVSEAAPVFKERLGEEDDPSCFARLVAGLVTWKETSVLPTLREFLTSEWARNDRGIAMTLTQAIASLEQLRG